MAATLLAVACSSPEKINVNAPQSVYMPTVKIYKKDDSATLQNAALGTLPFFYGAARGINLAAIKWNAPVNSENPGADCDLSYSDGKGASHFFRCIVKEGNAHIIVSIQEDLVEGRRMLRRVFMDGKGETLVSQWSSALERMGYKKSSSKASGVTQRFVSSNGLSIADIIWVGSTQSATLRVSPRL